ncbi:MAG TPA: hypothetical protein PKM59_03875, partial [Thermodesulfobacteriota bacterium]|nr:hypothetical protein [Thermodesulfobacteriota bacterium]
MEQISQNLVEETWQEIGGLSPRQGSEEMKKLAEEQPELLAFVVEFADDLSQEAKELAVYMFLVVYTIFRKAHGRKIPKLSARRIMASYDKNEKMVLSLEGAKELFFDRIAAIETHQPEVMKYVLDTLMEAPEEDEVEPLSHDDIGMTYLLLK